MAVQSRGCVGPILSGGRHRLALLPDLDGPFASPPCEPGGRVRLRPAAVRHRLRRRPARRLHDDRADLWRAGGGGRHRPGDAGRPLTAFCYLAFERRGTPAFRGEHPCENVTAVPACATSWLAWDCHISLSGAGLMSRSSSLFIGFLAVVVGVSCTSHSLAQ